MPFDAVGGGDFEVLERLRMGRDRVARGWCQHVLVRDHSASQREYCARGAVMPLVADGRISMDEVTFRAEDELYAQLPDGWNKGDEPVWSAVWVARWNNDWRTTQADVVALYERAIAAVEARALPVAA